MYAPGAGTSETREYRENQCAWTKPPNQPNIFKPR